MSEPPQHSSERRLAAVWFADIVGYSRLASQDERAALDLVHRFEAAARAAAERYHGRVVKFIGDAALAEFGSTEAAVRAALELRDSFAEIGAEGGHAPSLRIGMHIGEVVRREDGDLSGNGVNVAARLQTEAAPGQVLVSEDVWRQLRPLSDFRFEAAGERELRGIDARVAVFGAALAGDTPDRGLHNHQPPHTRTNTPRKLASGLSRRGLVYIGLACLAVLVAGLAVSTRIRTSPAADLPGAGDSLAAAAQGVGVQSGTVRSVAVLPFSGVGGEESEYFAEGISEEILNVLSQVPQLRVAARTSAFSFKNASVGLDSIARALNVEYVLEGSVRRSGDRVRISAQLVDASTGHQVWSHTYNREAKDVLAIQEEIAAAIANALQVKLAGGNLGSVARSRTVDPEAYELYLQGRHLVNKRTKEDLQEALQRFEAALQRDPAFAAAYSGLADAYALLEDAGALRGEEAFPKALAAAKRALELDELQAEAHASMGHILFHQRNWAESERAYQRALALNPSYATAHQWHANLLTWTNRPAEAVAAIERAYKLDPLSPKIRQNRGWLMYFARQYQPAIAWYQEQLRADPKNPRLLYWLAWIQSGAGQHAQAIATMQRVLEQVPEGEPDGWARTRLAAAYAAAGRREEATRLLTELEQGPPGEAVEPVMAAAYGHLGDLDRAFDWLGRAVEKNNHWMLELLDVDPAFDPLRQDPRFARILQGIR